MEFDQSGENYLLRGRVTFSARFETVPEAVSHYAKVAPDLVALKDPISNSEITYSALWERAAGLAGGLAGLHLDAEHPVVSDT